VVSARKMNAPDFAAMTAWLCFSAIAVAGDPSGVQWPGFRGPNASGVADGFPTPTTWSVAGGENIRWKTPIPGLGHSSPAIWGDRVFVTTAVGGEKDSALRVGLYGDIAPVAEDAEHSWRILCLDKKTGKILWDREATRGLPKVKRHPKATHANSTPATDGRYVVAFFGSEGLYCYTVEGELVWKKGFGVLDSGYYAVPAAQWGFGSSPVIHQDMVIVECDVEKDSFLTALNIKDGSVLWRTPRDEVPTWGTPTVHVGADRQQVIVNGYKHLGGYELTTGKELWKMKGGGDIPVPTPVVAHDLIFITNAHGSAAPVYAVRTSATGEIAVSEAEPSNAHVAWSNLKIGNYMQTPLVYGDLLYCCRDSGILACYDARTGEKKYRERLAEGVGFTASPVAADGKLYFTSEEGDVYVVQAGPEYKLLATNKMGEICMATPAVSEGNLFFRTQGHVVAIGR
jgi:outer membrane protein assembly factor BamB